MKFWWRLSPDFSIRKELGPKERNLLSRFRKITGRNQFPSQYVLLYFIEDKEPLRRAWPVLREIDEYSGSEVFKKFVDHRKEKLRERLSRSFDPDKRLTSKKRKRAAR